MNQEDFAKKIVKCTQAYWSMVLSCKRNLKYKRAKIVSSVLDTPVDLWLNPEASANDRREAWEKFNKGAK